MLKRRNFLGAWHAKHYDGRPRKNPLFAHREMRGTTKLLIAATGLLTLGAGACWLLLASPWSMVRVVSVEGLTTIDPQRVMRMVDEQRSYRRWFLFSQNNVFAFDEQKMYERLTADFALDALEVRVEGRSVIVRAQERIVEIVLRSGPKTYFYSLDGALVREAAPEEARAIDIRLGNVVPDENEVPVPLQPTMPILIDESAAEQPEISAEQIARILEIDHQLRAQHIEPQHFRFTNLSAPWTRIETAQEYAILLDLKKDHLQQLTSLFTVLAQKADPQNPYEYIDVRFGDHVYVK